MIITDTTGRKLKIGQTVHMMLVGTFEGKILAIKETPIVIGPQQNIPPHIVIQAVITPFIDPHGMVGNTYIIAEADPKDPLVKAANELASGGPRIVSPH